MLQCANKSNPEPLRKFAKSLQKKNTNPAIIDIIKKLLFPSEQLQHLTTPHNSQTIDTINEQTEIGIYQMFHGMIATKWSNLQENIKHITHTLETIHSGQTH